MNVALFMTLFTIFSTVTGVVTEGCKKLLDSMKVSYASNVLAFIVACFVGMGGTCIYYILNSMEFNTVNIVCIVMMGISTAFGAMIGYDKMRQLVAQILNNKNQ